MDGIQILVRLSSWIVTSTKISTEDVTLPDLLHAWWTFDGNGNDYSGNERHGEFFEDAMFGPGRFGEALDLTAGGFFLVPEEKNPGVYENTPRAVCWIKTRSDSGELLKWGVLRMANKSLGDEGYNGMGGFMNLGIYGTNQRGRHYQANDGKWRHLAVSLSPVGESSISVQMFMDEIQTKFLSIFTSSTPIRNRQTWWREAMWLWVGWMISEYIQPS